MLPYIETKLVIAICYNEYNISLLLCPERIVGDKGSVYPFPGFKGEASRPVE
jgi:hypothetical protein